MKKEYASLSRLSEQPPISLSKRDMEMLGLAQALAFSSNCFPHRVGAVVFKGNRVLARGYNRLGGHPFQHRWNKLGTTLHAEMHALILAAKDRESVEGASLAVARHSRKIKQGCSYPCDRCLPALIFSGIQNVICFSENDIPVKVRLTCD
jgi:deoxycytidylate deaminase